MLGNRTCNDEKHLKEGNAIAKEWAGGLAIGLRRGGDGFTCRSFCFWWWCSCFGLVYSYVCMFSFVVSFVASLMPGSGDEWAPCRAVGRMRGYLNKKKKIYS